MSFVRIGDTVKEQRVCVLGGSGFLGHSIVQEASARGYQVTAFDQRPSELTVPGVDYVEGNLLKESDVESAIRNCEAVFHCAAIADLSEADADATKTMEVNVVGTAQVASLAKEQGVERLLFASSVYATSHRGGLYRVSKQAAESLVREICGRGPMSYTILRYGSLYGPNSQVWNGLAKIVRSAVEERVLRYVGSPDAKREYIHISDAARLTVDALSPAYEQETLVISGINPISIMELLATLGEMLGIDEEPRIELDDSGAHYSRTPYSISRSTARKLVPEHFVELDAGLQELIESIQAEA